jgi:AraC-like DNA-binding protein
MDALSDVLRAVRLSGAVFFNVSAFAPWVAETPRGREIVAGMFPGSDHLISYHVITSGDCFAVVEGEPALKLQAGDVVVFPHGDTHVLTSRPGLRSPPDLSMYQRREGVPMPFSLSMGVGEKDPARLVCGFLGCDSRPYNPLLSALPRILCVHDGDGGAIDTLVKFALHESQAPRMGGSAVLGRLSELMFVDVVRRYLESLPAERMDWLSGLRDPFIGNALSALHRSPARDWTLETLAREIGLSRSAFAERFTQFVGHPPMQYLANWRMQLAANHLRSGTETVLSVANRVGYESEAAFSRAFKKAVGVPPGEWRREQAGGERS